VKVTDAQVIAEAARVEPTAYSFESERHEALCLLAFGQTWKVFVSERGARDEERSFDSEDAACIYFLRRLFELTRTH
jgi:hypothetical protein